MAPLTHISTDGFPWEPDSDTAQLSWLAANPMIHSGYLRVKPGESPAPTYDPTLWNL